MTQPGSIGSMMPASEDTQLRKFADLERFVKELGPSIAESFQTTVDSLNETIAAQAVQITDLATLTGELTATNAELTVQTAYQASLITRGISGINYTLATVPGDSTWRYVDAEVSVTLAVPTGRVLITVGCGEISLDPGDTSAIAQVTFNITKEGEGSPWWWSGARGSRIFSASNRKIGAGVSMTRPATVDVGTSTFTLAYGAWSASAVDSANVFISAPYINVQVIDAE